MESNSTKKIFLCPLETYYNEKTGYLREVYPEWLGLLSDKRVIKEQVDGSPAATQWRGLKCFLSFLLANRLEKLNKKLYIEKFTDSRHCGSAILNNNESDFKIIYIKKELMCDNELLKEIFQYEELKDINTFLPQKYSNYPDCKFYKYRNRAIVAYSLDFNSDSFQKIDATVFNCIYRLLPELFEKYKLTSLEKKLIMNLANIENISDAIDVGYIIGELFNVKYSNEYKKEKMNALNDFNNVRNNIVIEKLINEVQNLKTERRRHAEKYSMCSRQIKTFETEIRGLLSQNDSNDTELFDFFKACNNVSLLKANTKSGLIRYRVNTYYDVFKTDDYEIWRDRSQLKNFGCGEEMVEVLDKIFIDGKLKLAVSSEFIIDLEALTCTAVQDTSESELNFFIDVHSSSIIKRCRLYSANPHLDKYSCTGSYRESFAEMLARGDIIEAVNESIKSTQSINFLDLAVNGFEYYLLRVFGIEETGRIDTDINSTVIIYNDMFISYQEALELIEKGEI